MPQAAIDEGPMKMHQLQSIDNLKPRLAAPTQRLTTYSLAIGITRLPTHLNQTSPSLHRQFESQYEHKEFRGNTLPEEETPDGYLPEV